MSDTPPPIWETEDASERRWIHKGIHCHITKGPLGAWCGYVEVPTWHKWYGVDYNDIDIRVHGGLTYGDTRINGDYWIGFDCAHSNDLVPDIPRPGRSLKSPFQFTNDIYRTREYAIAQCESMAEQILACSDPLQAAVHEAIMTHKAIASNYPDSPSENLSPSDGEANGQ